MGLCQNYELHPKSFVSNFWGAVHFSIPNIISTPIEHSP